jgi:hypothetical protein
LIPNNSTTDLIIQAPGSQGYPGDLGLNVSDQAGSTWIYDTSSNYHGNYLLCPNNYLCWDINMLSNNASTFNPSIYIFRGFDPNSPISATNPTLMAKFTGTQPLANNNWRHH